jgi:hypothetical protein
MMLSAAEPARRTPAHLSPAGASGRQVRRLLEQVAFWQAMGFICLAALIWAIHVHDLVGFFFRDATPAEQAWAGAWVLTAGVLAIGAIVVTHTFLQQRQILRGFISVCSYCHKVHVNATEWEQMEEYITTRTLAEFTHGICPICYAELMKELDRATAPQPGAPPEPSAP